MSENRKDKDWWEKLGEKGQASYLAEHPNSQKALEARAKAEASELEQAVLEQELSKVEDERISELYECIGDGFDCTPEDFIKNIKELEAGVSSNVSSINQSYEKLFVSMETGEEFIIYPDSDSAYDCAVERAEELIEDIGFSFINGWEHYINEDKIEEFFEEYDEQLISDWADEKSDTHSNRLEEEMAFWADCNSVEDLRLIRQRQRREQGLVDELKNIFGDGEELVEACLRMDCIDTKELAEYCVDTDGVGHTLSQYDGREICVGEWNVYREN